jgi:ABC-2 type transport system ATP-binding protein
MHAQTIAISVHDLSKKYDSRFAVSHANFEVPLGSICGFVGPNGAGKTTTIRMLLGLISPTGGSGQILGHSIDDPDEYLKHVGAMIEGPAFYPALSGAENLHVLATLGGFSHERVTEVLTTVGLADRAQSKFKTYSLGMNQRLDRLAHHRNQLPEQPLRQSLIAVVHFGEVIRSDRVVVASRCR